ncbi:MAG: cation:proton antiporter [Candidatus Onthomonas sp.]
MSVLDWLSVLLIVLGEICILFSLVGVFRLDYVMDRMQVTTIADTLGTLLVFLGVMLHFGLSWISVKLLVVVLFHWMTAPVSAHMITRMIYYSKEEDVKRHAVITFENVNEDEEDD